MQPSAEMLVELTIADETLSGVRVVEAGDTVVTLSLALVAVPAVGAAVTMRWPAGSRGRYAQPGTVVRVDENRIAVEPRGGPAIEQHRHFVRGGGGERVLLLQAGQEDALGWVRNLSEQGIRAHFADVAVQPGDEVRLRIQLDADVLDVAAVATKVAGLRQTVPQRGPMSVELVAMLTTDEGQAQTIRRYIFRQELLTRTRSAG